MANGEHSPNKRARVSPPDSDDDATNLPTEKSASSDAMTNNVVIIGDTRRNDLQRIAAEWKHTTGIAPLTYALHDVEVHEAQISELQTRVADLEGLISASNKERNVLQSRLADADRDLSGSEKLVAELDQILPQSFKNFDDQGRSGRRDSLSSSTLGMEFIDCISKQIRLLNEAKKKVTENKKERDNVVAEIAINQQDADATDAKLQPARILLQKESLAVDYAKTRQSIIVSMEHLQDIQRKMVDLADARK